MNEQLLNKILDSDISKEVKDKVISYWLLPKQKGEAEFLGEVPLKVHSGRVGKIKRPSKEQLDIRNDPKRKGEEEAVSETLKEIL